MFNEKFSDKMNIIDHFESVIREIDIYTEEKLNACVENEKLTSQLNKSRDEMIDAVRKACDETLEDYRNTIKSKVDVLFNQNGKMYESQLLANKSAMFLPPFTIIADFYLSPVLKRFLREIILTNSKVNILLTPESLLGTFIKKQISELAKTNVIDSSSSSQSSIPNVVKLEKSLKTPNMESLQVPHNQSDITIAKIIPGVFSRNYERLNELNLSRNRIDTFDWEMFSELKSLKKLDLSSNKITALRPTTTTTWYWTLYQRAYPNLESLEVLDLSNNQIQSIQPEALNGLPSLKELNLNLNKLNLCNSYKEDSSNPSVQIFKHLNHLKSLKLSHNEITELNSDSFAGLEQLETLLLNNNRIEKIRFGTFAKLKKLTLLDLKANRIRLMSDETSKDLFDGLASLKRLDLANNQIDSFSTSVFTFLNFAQLEWLSLSGNRLSSLCEGFFLLPQLLELDLSNNQIKEISKGVFCGMFNLVKLNLSANLITTDKTLFFDQFSKLKFLFSRFNLADVKPSELFDRLTSEEFILTLK